MDSNSKQLRNIILLLISKNLPFAIYRTPGEQKTCIVVQTSQDHFLFDIEVFCNRKGFVIAPYESVVSKEAFLIRPDLFTCEDNEVADIYERISEITVVKAEQDNAENHIMDKEEYLEIAKYFIEQLKEGNINKIVLSKVVKRNLPKEFDLGAFFIKLKNRYSNAFVYIFNIPNRGLWIGATPETLLERKKNSDVVIMSLAGTALKPDAGKDVIWEEKEIQEQKYVTDYVRLKLTGLGIDNFQETTPETVYSGHLAHIKTLFNIPANEVSHKIGELVKRLHPTPAVCGLPKIDAYSLIEKAEIHKRKFYTGYLGPWGLDDKYRLFVNLRCAEIFNDKIFLYVGGGLTSDSVPEKEWEETEQKAKILLNVIEE